MTQERKRFFLLTACILVGLVAISLAVLVRRNRAPGVPTASAQKKEFVEYQQVRGEVKAKNSIVMSAPFGAGELQILSVPRTGTMVNKGDVVVQFDPTPVKVTLDQRTTSLRSVDAQIKQTDARSQMSQEQRKTDVLAAEYNVERAKLDTRKQEILSEIEAEKTKLVLADKEQKLSETQVKVSSGEQSGKADTESMKLKRRKALYDLNLAQQQLDSLTVRAPASGIVTISPNPRASGNVSFNNAPEFKPGDRAWSGASIAEIPDLSSLRVIVRVDEIDRGRLKLDQTALIHVDAVPDKDFTARIVEISTLGKPDFTTFPPPRNFDVALEIQDKDQRLRPGMSANIRIITNKIPNSIVVPTESVFEKNGRTIVYVLRSGKFQERIVTVGKRGSGECLITSGLRENEQIALQNPYPEAESK